MIPFVAYEIPRRLQPIFLEIEEVYHVRGLLIPELGNANAIARVDSNRKVNISATITSFGMNNSNNCTLEDIEAFGSSNFVKTLSLLCSRTQTPGKICRNAPYAQFLHTLMSSSY